MKLRSIILTAIASLAVFASCDKPVQLGEPQISVDPAELTLDEAASTQTVTLTATRMWKIDGQVPAWMTVSPTRGDGSNDPQTITIDVKANEGGNRSVDLNFTIGLFDATLKVAQAGPKGDAIDITSVKDFMANKDKTNEYTLKGVASGVKFQETPGKGFGGFDLTDGTGSMSCAFPANLDEFKSTLKNGSVVTIKGKYNEHDGKGQMYKGTILKVEEGEPLPEPEKPTTLTKATIAEFLAAEVNTTTWYELTGKITKISGEQYGNFYMEDATGKVFVYGLTKEFSATNNQSFASLGLAEGDEVTIATLRAAHSGTPQAGGDTPAYYISHKKGEGEVKPEKPDGEAKWAFTSSISWTVSENSSSDPTPSYAHEVKVNGATAPVPALKLGTGSKFGKSTLTIPAGTMKLGFYAIAWKGKAASLTFSNGTVVELERDNAGASGSSPYTLDGITAIDYYEIALKGDEGTLDVQTTTGMDQRAIIFGVNPVAAQ